MPKLINVITKESVYTSYHMYKGVWADPCEFVGTTLCDKTTFTNKIEWLPAQSQEQLAGCLLPPMKENWGSLQGPLTVRFISEKGAHWGTDKGLPNLFAIIYTLYINNCGKISNFYIFLAIIIDFFRNKIGFYLIFFLKT